MNLIGRINACYMKKILLLVAAALLFVCCSPKTTFEGIIIGEMTEVPEFFLLDPETGEYVEYPMDVDENGHFFATLDFGYDIWDAAFFVDKIMFRTCIEQGKHYKAVFDVTHGDDETHYSFEGDGAKENEFTKLYWNGFGIPYLFCDNLTGFDSFKSYSDQVMAARDECVAVMESAGNKGLAEYYAPLIQDRTDTYMLYFPYMALCNKGDYTPDADYEAFVSGAGLESMSDEKFQDIFSGVFDYVAFEEGLDIVKALALAEKTVDNKDRTQALLTSLLNKYIQSGSTKGLREAFAYYLENCDNEELIARVKRGYDNAIALEPGSPAPDIEFEDIDGKIHHLSEMKGTAVYVDVWATWCRPCCEEIPYLEKVVAMQKNDKSIRFISVSIDEDKDAWKAKVTADKPEWEQYIVTEKGQMDIAGSYRIDGIPRFMLIDKDGLIADVNAPRPSTSNIVASLKAMLQ